MKKHNILLLSSLVVFIISFTGCKDFFDHEVLGQSTSEDYYNTTYKLQTALNAAYNILQSDLYNECDWRFGEACADDVWGADEGLSSQMGQLVQFRFNTSNEWVQKRFTVNYKGINRANQVIANAHKVELTIKDAASYRTVRETLAQAKFLRALYYFNLVKTYGGVPIRPEIETVENLVVARSTEEEVYAYIEKDLREASVMLPVRFANLNAGKVGQAASVALLMKVIMYQTTPGEISDKWRELMHLGEYFVDGKSKTFGDILKFDGSDDEWEALRKRLFFLPKEEMKSTDVYELPETHLNQLSNAYSLDYKDYYGDKIDYWQLFAQIGEFSPCSIFEIVFKESADGTIGDDNTGSGIFDLFYSSTSNGSSPVTFSTADILDNIFSSDGRRKYAITHNEITPDREICLCGPSNYVSLKWYTPIKDRSQYAGDNGKNRRIIRYQDVVLMYAEALNECGEGARALNEINKTKAEANKINSSSELYQGGGYGVMRDNIWSERRREFAFEWDRYFDLVRQRRVADVIQTYGSKRANRRGYYFIKGVHERFPIPQAEIDISNGVVEQNPGY